MATKTQSRAERMAQVKRVVVKIGSSSLTGDGGALEKSAIRRLVREVIALRERGLQVAIVSSGAVAAGMGRLGMAERPRSVAKLQALAAVGQNLLVHTYETAFAQHDVPVGQVLLSEADILEERRHYENLRNTFRQLFDFGAVPVINENDSVAVVELKRSIGENDMLAAYVANMIQAELLVILSDVEGIYRRYRNGNGDDLISEVKADAEKLDAVVGRKKGRMGHGGMETKIRAARLLMACGEMTVIAHAGKHRLTKILEGQELGTLFAPASKRMGSRKRWIGFASPPKGSVVVDDGAVRAIQQMGCSLLPAGVIGAQGLFRAGDVVRVEDGGQTEVARGLSRYDSEEIGQIKGLSSQEVEKILGKRASEVIHRDDLVLL
ncbi:MAG: glutamate 5-kinase [Candidatus Latescibacterota bacterium]|nr:glutamate 5-kinase [Candidatus Latescibacterota bacterium]